MPLIAGPGAIATVMVLMARYGAGLDAGLPVVASIVITMLLTYLCLRSAKTLRRVLRQTGISILERVFGLILAAIAVQFVFDGVRELLGR
jgi:multiple antibiotic resistance protein